MNNLICYDFEDKVISHFTQWDMNHTITIKNLELTESPVFHFSNKNSKVALCVESEIDENGYITAKVPNILLREAVMLNIYIYITKNNTRATIYSINFPVRERAKPSEYTYSDNVEIIYIEDIMNEIKETKADLSEVMDNANTALESLNDAKQEAKTVTAAITEKLNNGDFIGAQDIQGLQGIQGEKGNDGFSPTVTVFPSENGHSITITDSAGNTTFTVLNGQKGEPGQDYILSDTDKQEIADLSVENAAEAANNANTAVQTAQAVVDLINEKLENGDFNGADYILTAADKTEIAKLVEPLTESMQGGTVTYEIPETAYEAKFFAFDRNNTTDPNQSGTAWYLPGFTIDLAEMRIDGEKWDADMEVGILQLPEALDDWSYNEQVNWYEENSKPYITVSQKPWCPDTIKSLMYYALRCSDSDTYQLQQIFRNDMKMQIEIKRNDVNEEAIIVAQPNLYTAENAGSGVNFFYPFLLASSESDAVSQTFKFQIFAMGNCPKYASDGKYATSEDTIEEVTVTFVPNNTFVEADENETV